MFGATMKKAMLSNGLPVSARESNAGYQSLVNAVTEPGYVSRYFLKGFLSYLEGLYSEGEISQGAYYSLVNRAVTLSAEAMTVQKVQTLLGKYEDYFERATKEFLTAD